MSRRITILFAACAGAGLALSGAALGQYSTGFETANGINASPGGTVLTGQDAYYIPPGTVSVDFLAYTYAGNTLGVSQNPRGASQFVTVEGPGGGTFGRAQRDITWPTGVVTVKYDATCLYTGQPPASNNLGSFSAQPYPGSASYIHLFSWVDPNTAANWRAFYLAYDANGIAHPQPGMSPGPAWETLILNNWYGFETDVDFAVNRITRVKITDLATNQSAEFNPTDWYLEGGQAGGRPHPTGFRMFSGGGTVGNVAAFDNMDIAAGGPPPYTCAISGTCPGTVRLSWSGARPSIQQGILFARNTGNFTIQSGPCQGTQLGLGTNQLQLYNMIGTGNGAGSVNAQAGQGACRGFVQLIQVPGCQTSNVAQVP